MRYQTLTKDYDVIQKPAHYANHSIEPLDYAKDLLSNNDMTAYQGALVMNVIKYISRFPYKGKKVEDLEKAQFYLNELVDSVSGDEGDSTDRMYIKGIYDPLRNIHPDRVLTNLLKNSSFTTNKIGEILNINPKLLVSASMDELPDATTNNYIDAFLNNTKVYNSLPRRCLDE